MTIHRDLSFTWSALLTAHHSHPREIIKATVWKGEQCRSLFILIILSFYNQSLLGKLKGGGKQRNQGTAMDGKKRWRKVGG